MHYAARVAAVHAAYGTERAQCQETEYTVPLFLGTSFESSPRW
jgi:hypothetical protein